MVNREVIQPDPENPTRWADLLRKSRIEAGRPVVPEVEAPAESTVSREELDASWKLEQPSVEAQEEVPAHSVEVMPPVTSVEVARPAEIASEHALGMIEEMKRNIDFIGNPLNEFKSGNKIQFDPELIARVGAAFEAKREDLGRYLGSIIDRSGQEVYQEVQSQIGPKLAEVITKYTNIVLELQQLQAEEVAAAQSRRYLLASEMEPPKPKDDWMEKLREKNLADTARRQALAPRKVEPPARKSWFGSSRAA